MGSRLARSFFLDLNSRHLCYDGKLESLAGNYGRQPIDLLDHPADDKEFGHLIHNHTNNYLCDREDNQLKK